MTVQTNTNVASFNGNGVTQIFPIAFKFNNDTDLVVLLVNEDSGASSLLTLNSDYTVSGEGNEEGGLINVVVAPAVGQRLKVSRVVDILQMTDLRNQGKFFAEVHEDAFDLLTMIAQQHESGISGSIRVAESDPEPARLPPIASRAGRLMAFDEEGNPTTAVPASGSVSEYAISLLNRTDPYQGAALIGFRPALDGATGRLLREKLEDLLSVRDFGAVGDGLADDSAAIQSAISAGVPLLWPAGTYRIASPLSVAPLSGVQWHGLSATVLCDFPAPVQRAILIDQLQAGDHSISGINIDGQQKCFVGLRVISAKSAAARLSISDMSIKNIYRSSQDFTEGNGIYVQGDFDVVAVDRVRVKDVKMAAGAGVSGSAGVTGISIRAGAGRPRLVSVTNCYFDNIASEDLSYFADQDGLLVWTDRNENALYQQQTTLNVSGCFFRNCLGRSIKCQTESADISGIRIVRTYGHTVPLVGVDIDLQVGGGRISGVSCLYSGWAPAKAVLLSATDELGKKVANGHVDGIEIAMGDVSMESVVQTGLRGNPKASYRVSNVRVEGGTLECVVRAALSDNVEAHVSLVGATAGPTLSFVRGTNGPGTGVVTMFDLVNTGASLVPAYTKSSGTVVMNASVVGGFRLTDSKYLLDGEQSGVLRVGAIGARDAAVSGVIRPVSFELANGATYKFPQSFRNVNSGMLLVSVGAGINAQGLYACDSAQVLQLTGGSDITVGTTSEPASGNYRLWSGASGPSISNRSGSTRTFTCFMIG